MSNQDLLYIRAARGYNTHVHIAQVKCSVVVYGFPDPIDVPRVIVLWNH